MSQPQGHSAAGKIMPMKKSSDTIGNQTRDTPVCSALPQPTVLLRAPYYYYYYYYYTPYYSLQT
jgi:hypothetical protein